MVRLLWFVCITWLAFTGPLPIAIVFGIGYAVRYQGAELILVGLLVDSGFGSAYIDVPWYTLSIVCLLLLSNSLAPLLRWQSLTS